MDKDGDFDIVASVYDESDLVVLTNEGKYAFWKTDTIDLNINNVEGIVLADIDKDARTDIIACTNGDAKVFWYKNNGVNTFAKRIVDVDLKKPKDAEATDFDGDGDIDLAVVAEDTLGYLTVYLNNGSGSFTKSQQFTGLKGVDIEIGDPNKDGKPDIFVTTYPLNGARGTIQYVMNKGNGTFEISTIVTAINNQKIFSLKYADINGDDEADLLYGYDDPGYSSKPIEALIYKQGKIEQTVKLTSSSRQEVTGIDVGDFNNDKIIDIIHTDYLFGDLSMTNYPCYKVQAINIGNDTTIRTNTSITLTYPFISGYSYRWSTGTTSRSITLRNPGTYSLTVTNDYGCPASDTIIIRATTSVKDIEELGISVYPNPTKGKIYIIGKDKPISKGTLEVVNILGQRQKLLKVVSSQQVELDISNLPPGAYFLSFSGDDYQFSAKILKE